MAHDTRERIIDTALELFHSRGYSATGVQEITRAAGVPKGSFYHFFPSKEELAEATVERYVEFTRLDLLTDASRAPLERIRAHIEHMAALSRDDGYERGCLLGNFSTEMPAHSERVARAVRSTFDLWADRLALAIDAAKAAGDTDAQKPSKQLAMHIVASLEGALAQAKLSRSAAPIEATTAVIFGALL